MVKATSLLRKAAELVREKQYQRAVEVYLHATETDPSDARAWFGLGVCLYRIGNLDVARIALERAQRMGYPKAEDALGRLAVAEQRRAERAEQKAAAAAAAEAEEAGEEPVEKMDLDRYVRVMLVEGSEADRRNITRAIESSIAYVEVSSVPYGVSTSDTMSGVMQYDVAIMDWDLAPAAAAGLMQILRIKRPALFIVCLLERWDADTVKSVLEAGADQCIVKQEGFARTLPQVIAQWSRRTAAVQEKEGARAQSGEMDRWLDAVDAVGDIILFIDADRTVLRGNQAALKYLRRGEDELVGRSYAWMIYSQEQPPDTCPIRQTIVMGEANSGLIVTGDSDQNLRVSAWPVRSVTGKVSGAVAVLREVGEVGEETAGKVAQSNVMGAILEKGIDHLECGVVALDEAEHVIWTNAVAAELLGGDRQALVGKDYRDIVNRRLSSSLKEPGGFVDALCAAYAKGENMTSFPLDLTDGTRLTYSSTITANGTGTIGRVEHFYAAEVTLFEPGPTLPPASQTPGLAVLPELVFTADAEGVFQWCSPGAADATGFTARSLQGMNMREIVAEGMEPLVESLFSDTVAESRRIARELRIRRSDGREYWGEVILLPSHAESAAVEGCLRDVSDRKALEAVRAALDGDIATV